MQLRPYQEKLVNDVHNAFKKHRRVMAQLPTGGGKTVCFVNIMKHFVERGEGVLLLVHRKELITQAASKVSKSDMNYGVIMAGYDTFYSSLVQLASVQTLIRRDIPASVMRRTKLIITDECHHATANSYTQIYKDFEHCYNLGFTATPIRTNGQGFDDVYDYMVKGPSVAELIDGGYLVAPKIFASPLRTDLSKIKKTAGDYNEKALAEVMDNNTLVGGLVNEYQRRANGRRCVTFAVNVEHSKHIVAEYRNAGISAAHIDGTTPQFERDRILRDFSAGKFLVLSNVGIVTEGFDVPAIEIVQLARPTKSLALYLQMVGRGLRPADGKDGALILDHANCVFEHGFPEQDRDWTLSGIKVKREDKDKKVLVRDPKTEELYLPEDKRIEILEDVELVEMNYNALRMSQLHELLNAVRHKRKSDGTPYKISWAWFKFIDTVKKPYPVEITTFAKRAGFGKMWMYNQYHNFGYNDLLPNDFKPSVFNKPITNNSYVKNTTVQRKVQVHA